MRRRYGDEPTLAASTAIVYPTVTLLQLLLRQRLRHVPSSHTGTPSLLEQVGERCCWVVLGDGRVSREGRDDVSLASARSLPLIVPHIRSHGPLLTSSAPQPRDNDQGAVMGLLGHRTSSHRIAPNRDCFAPLPRGHTFQGLLLHSSETHIPAIGIRRKRERYVYHFVPSELSRLKR